MNKLAVFVVVEKTKRSIIKNHIFYNDLKIVSIYKKCDKYLPITQYIIITRKVLNYIKNLFVILGVIVNTKEILLLEKNTN